MGFTGCDDIVVGRVLLEHYPHGFDVFACMPPVAFGIEVAKGEVADLPEFDARDVGGDFAGDKFKSPARGFVVEQDATGGVQAISLSIVAGQVKSRDFGYAIGRARMKTRDFRLGHFFGFAKHFARSGKVESTLGPRVH